MEIFTKQDINIKEWEFEFQQRDRQTILMSDLWTRALFENFQKEINLDVPGFDAMYTYASKSYTNIDKKKQVIDAIIEACKKEKYVSYIFNMTTKRMKEQNELAENIVEKINDAISNEELATLWKQFDEQFMNIIPWYYIPYYVIEKNILTDRVNDGLMKHKDVVEKITDLNNALMTLIFPIKEVVFQEEQRDFHQLVRKEKSNEEYEQEAQMYLNKYAWMKTFIVLPIEPLSIEELTERVQKAAQDKSLEEYELQTKQKEKNKKLANDLLEAIKDKQLLKDIEWARKYGWLLTSSVEQSLTALAKLIPLYKLIAKRMNVSYDRWNNLTSEEIVGILQGELKITEKELEDRENGHIFISTNGVQRMSIGKEGREMSEWIDSNVSIVDTNVSEFKGQPASPGLVKGKVRIALLAPDSHALEDNEILVCAMTSPDYLPAMKRASAIVTDEGGLLCHAAIVARELNKPCVIGTKIATRVLKNGDLVEVDATKGVIKIIEKAK